MKAQSLYHTYQRYRTLKTHRISALPIVILMPHSACNCRCVMCDIWKDNKNLKQLNEEDISGLLSTLKDLGTRQVLMSGGEALMNQHFFRLCQMLKQLKIRITLLSTGLLINRYTRSWQIFGSFFQYSKFHFFTYLCASEVLPLAVLMKILVQGLQYY